MDELSLLDKRVSLMERDLQHLKKDCEKEVVRLDALSLEMYSRTNAFMRAQDRMHFYMKGFAAALVLIPILGTTYNATMINEVRQLIAPIISTVGYQPSSTEFLLEESAKKYSLVNFVKSEYPLPCPTPRREVHLFLIDNRRFFEWSEDSAENAA